MEANRNHWGGQEDEVNSVIIVNAKNAAFAAGWATGHALYPEDSGNAWYATTKAEEAMQCQMLRCIIGNPFHVSPAIKPALLTPEPVALAQSIYDSRAFDRMPELADALEEAGCENREILDHCRSTGEHVRGCWVVDLILGKE